MICVKNSVLNLQGIRTLKNRLVSKLGGAVSKLGGVQSAKTRG